MTSQSCTLLMGEEKLIYLFLVSLNLVQHPKLKGICQGIKLGIRSLESLPLEDHERQCTAPVPDKAFNAILGRCAHWANYPNRTVVCQSLAPDRPEL
ncbi:hypothetical protein PanWU01x14_060550 [Parasponia andersonii]|uniref:Uncharacterized protein n=1 Tax=Parasponia andersonii TaxID=3476 RepID=A0A2P5DIU8_PARAD|nr:hypothetical protein PanWU01x14_060550 [Parasponia andersonii]